MVGIIRFLCTAGRCSSLSGREIQQAGEGRAEAGGSDALRAKARQLMWNDFAFPIAVMAAAMTFFITTILCTMQS